MRLPSFLQRFDTVNLRLRVISSTLMVPGVLLAVWIGSIAYGAAVACAMTLGLYEWLRMTAPNAKAQNVGIACALLLATMTGGFVFSIPASVILGAVLTLALFALFVRDVGKAAAWAAFGLPYMGGSGLALLALRDMPHGGANVFYLLMTVWGTDIGAYAFGRMIGGPKLAPKVSPNKTWAGLIGGMALAALSGYGAASLFGAAHPAVALILSPVLAAVAQIGDLFESHVKRRAGVKESGDLIPGHGGILDRIDGLVFAAMAAAGLQAACGGSLGLW